MAYRQLEEKVKDNPGSNPLPSPEKPIGRITEIEAIRNVLHLVTKHSNPLHVWIWGPQGSGKTLCATHVALELAKVHRIPVALSNCWKSNSLYALVNDLIDQFSILRAELQDTRFKLDRIKRHFRDRQCVYIIDEIDRLEARERNAVLYQFQDLQNFWIIAISHKSPQQLGIEPRVWSRLSPILINFSAYATEEVIKLLNRELETSGPKVKPTLDQLREIAETSGGDARHAKKLLTQRILLGLPDIGPSPKKVQRERENDPQENPRKG